MEANDSTLLAELRRDEREVPHEYKDSLGFSTIGVGRLIDKRKGGGLSSDEIAYLLANDVRRTMADLDKYLPWWRDMSEPRQRAITSMCFNLGIGSEKLGSGLLGFKNTLAKMKAGDYEGAAQGMLASRWSSQVGARAERLAKMMKEG